MIDGIGTGLRDAAFVDVDGAEMEVVLAPTDRTMGDSQDLFNGDDGADENVGNVYHGERPHQCLVGNLICMGDMSVGTRPAGI